MAGRTLGLVGCGRVGEQVARFGHAFDMRVVAFDPYRDILPDSVGRAGTLAELAAVSDVVSIHVPLSKATAA